MCYKLHNPDLQEEDTILSLDNPDIYIRQIKESDKTKNGKDKIRKRMQNPVHACIYCGMLVQHIQPHWIANHASDAEVKEIIANIPSPRKQGSKWSRQGFETKMPLSDLLRASGDNKHNKLVVEKKKGELLLYRRPKGQFHHEDFGPCPNCGEWLLKSSLVKHQKACTAIKTGKCKVSKSSKRNLVLECEIQLGNVKPTSELLKSEVLSIMTSDLISNTAQGDNLILLLGENWLRRNLGNKLKRKYYSSGHMRHAAKLLIFTREREGKDDLSMWDCLRPAYMEIVIEAALDTAIRKMDDEEELKSPSNAIKIKHDIIKTAKAKRSSAVRNLDKDRAHVGWQNAKDEAEEFFQDVQDSWTENVSRLAYSLLKEYYEIVGE